MCSSHGPRTTPLRHQLSDIRASSITQKISKLSNYGLRIYTVEKTMDDSLALFASFYASHVSKDALTHESDSMQRLVIPQAECSIYRNPMRGTNRI